MKTWESHGLKCLARISAGGVPCGYVGVSINHPDFEKHYDDIGQDIEVHGGLTFAGYWEDQADGLWYVGFDCGHAWDMDYDPALGYTSRPRLNKSMSYVEEETERLAEQMAKRG
jgi:hypothetical protein